MQIETVTTTLSHRVTIRAKYLPVTNHRGSRIVVTRDENHPARRLTVGWDYALDIQENYQAAIRAYLVEMGWGGHWVVSMTSNGAVGIWVGEA